jgi:hypothetical protein
MTKYTQTIKRALEKIRHLEYSEDPDFLKKEAKKLIEICEHALIASDDEIRWIYIQGCVPDEISEISRKYANYKISRGEFEKKVQEIIEIYKRRFEELGIIL